MHAVVVRATGAASVLEPAELATPEPGPEEITIDVAFAGVGFVDTLFRSGALPLQLPFVPGIEVTGTVRELGAGVTGLVPGEAVGALLNDFGRTQRAGGYATVAVAHQSMCAPLPDGADLPRITGALINGVTARIALRELAQADRGDAVVVLGAGGGLGGITCRQAALLGCRRVVGVVGRDLARAPEQCTDAVLNEDFAAWVAEAGNAPDVVIDPVGGSLRAAAFGALAPFGRHVVLGNASGDDPPISGDAAWHGTRTLMGLSLGAVAHLRPAMVQSALRAVVDAVAGGALAEPAPAIVALDDAAGVHEALESRTAPPKTVLDATR